MKQKESTTTVPTEQKFRSDKKVFTLSDLDMIEKLAELGHPVGEICDILGMARSTFYERAAEMPELLRTVKRGKANGKSNLLRKALRKAYGKDPSNPEDGDNDMIKFLLARAHGMAEKQVVEHLEARDFDSMTDEELWQEFDKLKEMLVRQEDEPPLSVPSKPPES